MLILIVGPNSEGNLMRFYRPLFLVSLLLFVVATGALAEERPLTNDDVISMTKADLGDAVISSKIAKAPATKFDTSPEGLVKLKKAGVSPAVIGAMLDRDAGGAAPTAPPTARNGSSQTSASRVRLITPDGTLDLSSYVGSESSTYAYVTMLFWLNFPGLHSAQRTHDSRPAFLLKSDQDPRSRYFIVRLDVNEKSGDRSLKMGKGGAFSFKATTTPDSDWTFPFDSERLTPDSWKLKLKAALKPGEYGVYAAQNAELYEFGVD
ncbi:MAG TPA: hypothetical protein VLC46_09840 [Thermoanaerobaculia bacterium]|nr:hypothetical protein [Thermoanaerobaculia bacterium]